LGNIRIEIEENGCFDPEVRILDTKIPYFCDFASKIFLNCPNQVVIKILNSKKEFDDNKGKETTKGVFSIGSTVYIYQPSLFGKETTTHRKDFYRVLCQELIYIFYITNKEAS
jgi:hypothetical protein